jgi:hypothetical protein
MRSLMLYWSYWRDVAIRFNHCLSSLSRLLPSFPPHCFLLPETTLMSKLMLCAFETPTRPTARVQLPLAVNINNSVRKQSLMNAGADLRSPCLRSLCLGSRPLEANHLPCFQTDDLAFLLIIVRNSLHDSHPKLRSHERLPRRCAFDTF